MFEFWGRKVVEDVSAGKLGAADVSNPNVAILLCTMQGQPHLREQLDSILGQTRPNWSLWVSDDGSTDGTHDILAEYAHNRLRPLDQGATP
jgi:cellulose synthase/poly-beta-1,6-N-acetylglucosamine synthase-like glycosyltransferase